MSAAAFGQDALSAASIAPSIGCNVCACGSQHVVSGLPSYERSVTLLSFYESGTETRRGLSPEEACNGRVQRLEGRPLTKALSDGLHREWAAGVGGSMA